MKLAVKLNGVEYTAYRSFVITATDPEERDVIMKVNMHNAVTGVMRAVLVGKEDPCKGR